VLLLSAAIFSSISFAGTGAPLSSTALIQGSSGGTKLFGTIMIEYGLYHAAPDYCFDSKVVLRLGRDSALKTFTTADLCLPADDPAAQRDMIMQELASTILGDPDISLGTKFTTLTVVTFNEYVPPTAVVTGTCTLDDAKNPANPCHDEYIVADVTLSAN